MAGDAAQPVCINDALVGETSGAPKSVTDENAVTVTTFCAVRLTGRQAYALEALNPTKVRQPGPVMHWLENLEFTLFLVSTLRSSFFLTSRFE